jgi:hypothetical protein
METFTMNRREVHRPGLLKAACAGRITTRQLAEALRISLRHALAQDVLVRDDRELLGLPSPR